MKINEANFKKVIAFTKQSGMKSKEIAAYFSISERQLRYIKEAGTWERWPYIQAKIKWGYNTPEYKLYLKRRGLPLTPPAKIQVAPREQYLHQVQKNLHTEQETRRRSLLDRILGRK